MNRFDLASWIQKNSPPNYKTSRSEWSCDCPKCGRSGKLAVNVERHRWQCWICGFRGRDASFLVAAYLGLSVGEASVVISQATLGYEDHVAPLEVKKSQRSQRFLPTASPPPGTSWELVGSAKVYVDKRGVPEDHAGLFSLSSILGDGTNSKADRMLTGRLLIPVWIERRFVYWIARDITGKSKIKVINLPSYDRHQEWGLVPVPGCAVKNEVLVGLHLVRPGDVIYLVEGPMDAVVGGLGFVATMGSSLSVQQAHLIVAKKPSRVVVLYDGDEAGRKGSKQVFDLLSPFVPTSVARCPDGKDPADLGRRQCIELSMQQSYRSDYIGPLC